jgi:outer membrane protein assembly factor BamB
MQSAGAEIDTTAMNQPSSDRFRGGSQRLRLFPVVGLLCVCIGLPGMVAADDAQESWPIDRGNPNATGAVPQTLPDEISELWRYEAEEMIDTTAVIAGGKVFVGDVDGTLHAVSLETGKLIWKHKTDLGFLAAPTANTEMVVIGDLDGIVYAFEAATGKPLWQYQAGAEIGAAATIVDSTVLVSSQDGNLYALDAKAGTLLWKYETGDQIRCRPTVTDGRTFLGGCDASLHSILTIDGKPAAEPLPLDGPTGSTPAILGDRAFLPTQTGTVLAFNWKTGEQLWSYVDPDRPQEFRNSAAVVDGHVVVCSKNRSVLSLDPATGKVQWTTMLRKRADGSPVIAGKDVWVAAADGRLYRLALADGKELWQYEVRGAFIAPPAIAGERLIVANDKGTVICLGSRATP